jgi:hypothetical protein
MTTPISGLEVATFDAPDETPPAGEKATAALVNVGGQPVWKYVFEPGWRYTEHADAELCSASHAGYIESGRLRIVMEDGAEAEAGPGSAVTIGPGHDAWTVGDEDCVLIDFGQCITR